jgi:hypothetical protein
LEVEFIASRKYPAQTISLKASGRKIDSPANHLGSQVGASLTKLITIP